MMVLHPFASPITYGRAAGAIVSGRPLMAQAAHSVRKVKVDYLHPKSNAKTTDSTEWSLTGFNGSTLGHWQGS